MKIKFAGDDNNDNFRSNGERTVAKELDRFGVTWRYEVRLKRPDGRPIRYLPDFTIDHADKELELPRFVECKPQKMLYDLRDQLGVTRRAGEYFQTDVIVEDADAHTLKNMGVEELWKPKALAEMLLEDVLVIGGVGGTSMLTVTMRPTSIVFRRNHPFVNHRKIEADAERERQRAEAEARWARIQQERTEAERSRSTEDAAKRAKAVRTLVAYYTPREPRFASACLGCGDTDTTGHIYKVDSPDGLQHRWMRVCGACEAKAR